jgi:SSS family solute:Na+ symporter
VAGNVAGLVLIAISASWAPQIQHFDSVVKYFQQLLSYMAPPVVAVFLAGLFWKRASSTGAITALLSGFVVALLLLRFIGATPLAGWHFLYVAPVLFVLSLAVLVAVSLATTPPTAEVVGRYVWRPAFFRDESAELAARPWFANYRILSLILLILTLTFFILWK